MTSKAFDHNFKLVLVGDSATGKSSIITQFTEDEFKEQMSPTIGVDFKVKFMNVNRKKVKLTIFDTAGNAHGIILVYDVTREETFNNIKNWLKECDLYSTFEECVKLLIGNKIDLKEERKVSLQDAQNFAKSNNMVYIETSAKTKENVDKAFEEVVYQILNTTNLLESTEPVRNKPTDNVNISTSEPNESEGGSGCCW
ncbi:rab family small GTPase [Naegleria gruberi]|uniref:Rab family small GTPase n=1 Tax=Naegleria gruberi TaxID=5762 RepID=D2W5W3_NAEGR|nr:rab family small GTPase [Naegleria gruberi]EFC35538.1 rab family small GTPase [Naegleria gruberi]|eukprot:XP_002668282.1 rab family small GTPase [Naegleria gruberi strain NEG-M]